MLKVGYGHRMLVAAGIAAVTMLTQPDAALAEWSPQRPIQLLIGFNEGGGADALARLVADNIEGSRGWTVVPINRGGAGGGVMATLLRNAAPDGHTIGMGVTTTFSNNPFFNEGMDYSPEDFDYLATIARSQMVLVAREDAPFDTLDELAETARERGSLTVAVMGPDMERVADMIADHYDIDLRVVPTRGGAEVLTQILGGHVDAGFNGGAHHQYIRSGDMKVVVNLNSEPLMVTPEVANLRDHGIDYATNIFFQFQAPAGLPDDVREALATAIDEAVNSDGVRQLAGERMEMQLGNLGPEALSAMIMDDARISARLAGTE
ncbi:MAG: tripartite tricarboxylate transporter substrate binding protein [Pararhodobacter sp.]|nr:tripartite tricarboxylate transporter substrate binding protein [Pararhodobacter sp.]